MRDCVFLMIFTFLGAFILGMAAERGEICGEAKDKNVSLYHCK